VILLIGFVIDVVGRGTEGHLITFVGATWIAVTILRVDKSAQTDDAQPP
jgi:hypothetical protein